MRVDRGALHGDYRAAERVRAWAAAPELCCRVWLAVIPAVKRINSCETSSGHKFQSTGGVVRCMLSGVC